jgi:hypothetical protein
VLAIIALALLFWSAVSLAQAQTATTNLPPAIQDVIKLTRAGITEEVILAELKSAGVSYKLTPDQIIYLSNQGVSESVIQALIRSEAPVPAPPPGPPAIPPTGAPPTWAHVPQPLTLEHLRELLAPYGTWLDVAPYGSCWRPTAATADLNWHPYAQQGHWIYTEAGWFWHSDYSWGDTVFHFGRWFLDKGTWVWVPGNAWAPAWVCWREANAYLGWAPLPPLAVFKAGVGLQFDGATVGDSGLGLGPEAFTFVPDDKFWERNLGTAMLSAEKAAQVFTNSVVKNGYGSVNGVFVVEGVGRERVAALTHREVKIETPVAPPSPTIWRDEAGKLPASDVWKSQPGR